MYSETIFHCWHQSRGSLTHLVSNCGRTKSRL